MKVVTSVLVGSLSGAAGDVVAAKWKGRQYARQRVVPANPRTVDQTSQRDAFAHVVDCYQSLPVSLQAFLDLLGRDRQLSGFNVAMAESVKAERTSGYHDVVPNNPWVPSIVTPAFATGAAGGKVTVTWDIEGWLVTDIPLVLQRIALVPTGYKRPWTLSVLDATPKMNGGTATVTGLTVATDYAFVLFGMRDVATFAWKLSDYTDGYSGGASGHAESSAAE